MRGFRFLSGIVALILSTACIQIQRVRTEGEVEIREVLVDAPRAKQDSAISEKKAPLPVANAKVEVSANGDVTKQSVAPVGVQQKKENAHSATSPKLSRSQERVRANAQNRVIITCPTNLKRLIVERVNKNGTTKQFFVVPGKSVTIYAQTPYLDQLLVLVVHGYKYDEHSKNKEVCVGRATKQYGGTEFINSGHTVFWNVTTGELLQ